MILSKEKKPNVSATIWQDRANFKMLSIILASKYLQNLNKFLRAIVMSYEFCLVHRPNKCNTLNRKLLTV